MRAILYVRVSKGDGQEPETQLQALREWARSRSWRVIGNYVDRVTGDPARRGRTPAGLVAALDAIERKKAEVLMIFAADRLVRSPVQLLQLVGQVQSYGGRVASLQDGADLDTTTDTGELLLFLRGWWAKMELRLTRERTRAGLARARSQGKQLGRPRAELPDADEVARRVEAGQSLRLIARELGDIPVTRVYRVSKTGSAKRPVARREKDLPRAV